MSDETLQKPNQRKQLDEKALRHKAVEFLARREYSYSEIEKKLQLYTQDQNAIETIQQWLIEMGLQSDQRFAAMYVRSKALAGYGPVRIKLELKNKGINEYLIEESFDELNFDWGQEVDRLIPKKLDSGSIADMKAKQKCMAFLQRRGFSLDQIYAGLDRFSEQLAV